ncbi:hypothetical protein P3X46_014795 [Hevea brasiliensis]|uniref:Glycosyltransferase n=1 Tax=Hevea brasiliensis TaxID=3981 RepID=A0ABQ9LTW1_HEVBR|nr:putative UDP-rhamnose:rhamnosyltransferase 1 [Hevea brasiliensis]KAJ9171424.1 hypothetical protein P3X46_014795 [Hevea brasiliensis]
MAGNLHVVMVPWSAFGHLIPMFQLSIALAKAGAKVSILSTPRNIQRLPKIPQNLTSLIHLVEVPFPTLLHHDEQVLPEGAEATVDIPLDKIQYLKVAYDLLQQPLRQFVSAQSPDWIITDLIAYWAVEIAQEHHVSLMAFSVFSVVTLLFCGPPEYLVGDGQKRLRSSPESWTKPPEWADLPSSIAFKIYEAVGLHAGFYENNASGKSDAERAARVLQGCQAVAFRTCSEYEGEYINLYEKLIGKPVIPVGLLPQLIPEKTQFIDESWRNIFNWLDKQKHKSVVFVGFGSECKLTKDQVYEIAYGLELSGLPFLWALRKPSWANKDLDALPSGFGQRTSKTGIVGIGWAPQMEILAHPSIGGSLFHSGLGSVIETLQFGHCLVVLPMTADQPLNARFLVEKELAVEVERSEDGSFSRNGIAKALRLAMVSEEGEKYRMHAKEAAQVFGNHNLHQNYYINMFVEFLKNGVAKG